MNKEKINIYIDGNNLYMTAKELGFEINYKSFFVWLKNKYATKNIFLFLGHIKDKEEFYTYLKDCGFILIFKETTIVNGKVKGNCDAELVLNCVYDFCNKCFDKSILITGDGDFGVLVSFLKEKGALHSVISPNKNKCSILIKNKNVDILFLNKFYLNFSKIINEKAPNLATHH